MFHSNLGGCLPGTGASLAQNPKSDDDETLDNVASMKKVDDASAKAPESGKSKAKARAKADPKGGKAK